MAGREHEQDVLGRHVGPHGVRRLRAGHELGELGLDDVEERLEVLAREELGADRVTKATIGDLRRHRELDEPAERLARIFAGKREVGRVDELPPALLDQRGDELVLVRKAAKDRADADAGALRDHADRRVDPLLGEDLARSLQDAREVSLCVGSEVSLGSDRHPASDSATSTWPSVWIASTSFRLMNRRMIAIDAGNPRLLQCSICGTIIVYPALPGVAWSSISCAASPRLPS